MLKGLDSYCCGISRNIGCYKCVLPVIRSYCVFATIESHSLAVNGQGKFVVVCYRKFLVAIVATVIIHTDKFRCLKIAVFHKTATAKLFMGVGFPYTGVGVVNNLNTPYNADSAVDENV